MGVQVILVVVTLQINCVCFNVLNENLKKKCLCQSVNTVEPPRKGHFGELSFDLFSEVVLISETS